MTVGTDLKTAFPAEFENALSNVVAADVEIDRDPPSPPRDYQVWIRPPTDFEFPLGGASEPEARRIYRVRVSKRGGDEDDLEAFAQEVTRHFHGARRPNVAGLRRMLIENLVADSGGEYGNEWLNPYIEFDLVALTREAVTST